MPPIPLPPSLASAYRGTAQTPLLGPSAASRSDWTRNRIGLPTGASVGDPWWGPHDCRIIGTSKMNEDPDSHASVDVQSLPTAIRGSQYERPHSERAPRTFYECKSEESSPIDESQPTEGKYDGLLPVVAWTAASCIYICGTLYGIQKFVFEDTTNMRPLSESPVLLEHPHSFSGLRRSVRNGTRAAVETIQKKLGLVKEEDLLEDENVHPMYGNPH